jgi:exodeoxyribonuclease VII small subunit
MPKNIKSYQELSDKLDGIILTLENPSTTIDEAINLYKEADKLIESLQDYLENSRNEIKAISKHSTDKAT